MNCPKCGKTSKGSICDNCGYMPMMPAWVCTKCGTYFSGDKCNICGTKTDVMNGKEYPYVCPKCGLFFCGNVCPECGQRTDENNFLKMSLAPDRDDNLTHAETKKQIDKKETISVVAEGANNSNAGKKQSYKVAISLCIVSAILGIAVFCLNGVANNLKEQIRETEVEIAAAQEAFAEKQKAYDAAKVERETLQAEVEETTERIRELEDEKKELENSPKNQLKRIHELYEQKDWNNVLKKTAALQEEYPDAEETAAAQRLAEESQIEIDKIEEKEAATEVFKSYIGEDPYTVYQDLSNQGYTITVADMSYDASDGMGEYILEEGEFGGADSIAYYSDDFLQKEYHVTDIKVLDLDAKKIKMVMILNALDTKAYGSNTAGAGSHSTLESKLDSFDAWVALEEYGKQMYPFGFELHYILGKIAEEPSGGDTWFLKASCTIENAFGNEYDSICEGRVTGTTSNPKVTYFYVY